MMKPLCRALLLAWLASAAPATAQPGEPFAVTPAQYRLAGDAPSVVRLEELRFVVARPGRATLSVRRAVTILKAEGRDQGRLYVSYDRLRRLKKITGAVRDAQGKVLRKLRDADQEDQSAISDYSLYEEARIRTAALFHDVYPYTVEYTYELDFDGLINWPDWYPQAYGEAVEYGSFELDAPAELALRHMVRGLDLVPEVEQRGGRQVLRWKVRDLPAFKPEPFGPAAGEQAAAVLTAPAHFEIEGTQGEMTSWQAFGRWYHGLLKDRQQLPPEALADVRARVADAADTREQIRRLYAFMQDRTRYVSIQLGLGGWQPFDARYVHQRGYGDCKALTNYMLALLQAIDVPAYPVLIRRGLNEPQLAPDFPSNQFNHVVLAVPLDGDTLWLENTSQTIPFGHLGADNEDRHALMVTPEGGVLVRTPRSRAADNRQLRHGRLVLTGEGHATADVQTVYTGNQQDHLRHALARRSARDREQWLHHSLSLPAFEVTRADFSEVETRQPEVRLPLSLRLPRYAARTGTRLFFRPNLLDAWTTVPPALEARTQSVRTTAYAFEDVDSLAYVLPEGYVVEALPEQVVLETSFGRYEAVVEAGADGTLLYRRSLALTDTRLAAAEYGAFRDFLRQVAQADRAQVVLVRR